MHQNQAPPPNPRAAQPSEQKVRPKIIFVAGKGGVGKSLIAAGIASDEAKRGQRVLLAEIGDKSYYQDFFELSSVGHEPTRTALGFDLAMWSGETCLKEYVLYYLKLERIYHIFFENKVMRALINVAPGLNEIAILGKITSGIRKVGPPLPYDVIVVDCFATGHAIALLQAPRGMMQAIGFGPMGTHSREIDAVIRNPALCRYVIVTLLEEMPVTETLEFRVQLANLLNVIPDVIGNKVLELPVSEQTLGALLTGDPKGIGEFSQFLLTIHQRQQRFRQQLLETFGKILEVPLILSNEAKELVDSAREALRQV